MRRKTGFFKKTEVTSVYVIIRSFSRDCNPAFQTNRECLHSMNIIPEWIENTEIIKIKFPAKNVQKRTM